MPTGRCEDQVRHSVARAPVVGLVVAIVLGGLIVMASHSFAVTVAVVIVLLVALAAVVMLFHRHNPFAAEHQHLAIRPPAARQPIAAAPRPQVIERHHYHQLSAPQPAPQIHNHLHIHGVLSGEQQRQLAQITTGQSPTATDEN